MRMRSLLTLVLKGVCFVILVTAPTSGVAMAQERPAPTIELAAGSLLFADDGVVNEGFVGGAARVYVLPRISVGPELSYVRGDNHSHLIVTGNLTCDLLSPVNGRPRPVTPFLVAGGGLFQTREAFPGGGFRSSEWAFTAGGGVRAALGDRFSVGFETRIGWELHIRVNGFVGVRLGD